VATYAFNPFTNDLDIVGTGGAAAGVGTTVKARQALSPAPNGSVTVFTLPTAYVTGSVTVFVNGLSEINITESGSAQVTFSSAPFTGDQLSASYEA